MTYDDWSLSSPIAVTYLKFIHATVTHHSQKITHILTTGRGIKQIFRVYIYGISVTTCDLLMFRVLLLAVVLTATALCFPSMFQSLWWCLQSAFVWSVNQFKPRVFLWCLWHAAAVTATRCSSLNSWKSAWATPAMSSTNIPYDVSCLMLALRNRSKADYRCRTSHSLWS